MNELESLHALDLLDEGPVDVVTTSLPGGGVSVEFVANESRGGIDAFPAAGEFGWWRRCDGFRGAGPLESRE